MICQGHARIAMAQEAYCSEPSFHTLDLCTSQGQIHRPVQVLRCVQCSVSMHVTFRAGRMESDLAWEGRLRRWTPRSDSWGLQATAPAPPAAAAEDAPVYRSALYIWDVTKRHRNAQQAFARTMSFIARMMWRSSRHSDMKAAYKVQLCSNIKPARPGVVPYLLLGEAPVAAAQGARGLGTRAEVAGGLKAHAPAGVLTCGVLRAVAADPADGLPKHAAQAAQGQRAQLAAQLTGQLRLQRRKRQ